jgi:hypothetical protein
MFEPFGRSAISFALIGYRGACNRFGPLSYLTMTSFPLIQTFEDFP